jgi:hypothetical protein
VSLATLAALVAGATPAAGQAAHTLRLCADFALFPDNHRLPSPFALAGYTFKKLAGGPDLFVNASGGGKGLQFPDPGMRVTLPAPVAVAEVKLGVFGRDVTVTARDAAGAVVQTTTVPHAATFQSVTISAPAPKRISALDFTGGSNEGNLASMCVKLEICP